MAIPSSFLEEVKNRIVLSDVVGRVVRLTRRGHEHTGLCPFHNEKTPSFTVNDVKAFYHCFGCGAHGNVFDFLIENEGLSFPEAVERAAAMVGMEVPKSSPGQIAREQAGRSLIEIMETAAAWFSAQLDSAAGREARAYLDRRGLGADTIGEFRLGYAPNGRDHLKEAMIARGVAEEKLVEAGLLVRPDDGSPSYDRFRHRLMFPIADGRGRVIAFGGRALGEARAKYLNSPETPLFHKGRTLYNIHHARKPALNSRHLMVGEGYMDVIALSRAGYAAVAPLGTALTEDQLRLLWKMVPEPTLCLDGDSAGWRAAGRAAERALPLLKPGHSLRFAILPPGMDPDDVLREQGREALDKVLGAALPLTELLWRRRIEDWQPLDTPERKAGFERALMDDVGQIADTTVRDYYRSHFRERLWREIRRPQGDGGRLRGREGARRGPWRRGDENPYAPTPLKVTAPVKPPRRQAREELLVLVPLNHPEMIEQRFEEMAQIEFAAAELDKMCSAILEIAARCETLDRTGLQRHLAEVGLKHLVDRLTGSETAKLNWFAQPDAELSDALRGWDHAWARHMREVVLRAELRAAERALAENNCQENFERLLAAKAQLETGPGTEAEGDFSFTPSARRAGKE